MALKDVLLEELRDMYSAENQLVKALPKLAKGAQNSKLKQLFTAHLQETKGQVERLKKVFAELEEKPTANTVTGWKASSKRGRMRLKRTKKAHRLTPASSEQPCGRNIMRSPATRPVSLWQPC